MAAPRRPSRSPLCAWVLACLPRLQGGPDRHGMLETLSLMTTQKVLGTHPRERDCRLAVESIARTLRQWPWYWKRVCGVPPHPAVRRVVKGRPPFQILDKTLKAYNLPASAPAALRKAHAAHPDLCRARVRVRLRRPYQGWVVAQAYQQHDCTPESLARRTHNPALRPVCQVRPYPKKERVYLHYRPAGTVVELSFYFGTPPAVCLKPGLTRKRYPTGCYCLGLDEQRLTLIPEEDPFLLGTPIPPPAPRPRPPRAKGARPRGSALDGLFD